MSKQEAKSTVLPKHHLKALKLPTMLAECEKVAARVAADNADHLTFLLQLCELELIERERRSAERRLKDARFAVSGVISPSIDSSTSVDHDTNRSRSLCSGGD